MIILPSPAKWQRDFAPNLQYCEFQAEFAANSHCERIRSEFGEFILNSLRICIRGGGSSVLQAADAQVCGAPNPIEGGS